MGSLKYWVWLNECRGLTNRSRALLLEHFGSPEEIYYADAAEYALVEGLAKKQLECLADKSTDGADKILGDCQRLGLRILTMQDADYPARLRSIFEPPCVLYVKGTLPAFDEEVCVAMVGTRACTPYGTDSAEKLAYGLAKQGALVISGAARGIDSAALRGALRAGGVTAAVLGNGLDVVYPEENAGLYRDIAATGALLSEYPPGTAAEGWHFPIRNRIISGLSLATVIVEAPLERSGALITANTALEQGRDVFAVPGPIDAPMSRGCNRLIADGAGLVSESWDILREYEALYPHKILAERVELPHTLGYRARSEQESAKEAAAEKAAESALPVLDLSADNGLTDDQLRLLRELKAGEKQVDDLIELTQIPTRRVLSALTMLELDGYVAQSGGKRFSILVELKEE